MYIACSVMVSWSKKVGDPYVRECSRRNYSSHSEADVEDKEMDGDAGVSLFCLTRRVLENELEFGIELEDVGSGHADIVGPYDEWWSKYEAIKAEQVLRMEFSSSEEARKFYNDYSRVKGFVTRQWKKIKNIYGKIVWYTIVCNREGFRHKKWLEKSDQEHNHELLLSKFVEYLRSHQKISDFEKAQLNSMREIDMYNEMRRLRAMQNGDVNTTFRYLEGIARVDEKLFWRYKTGTSKQLCNLFWSDGASQEDYRIFGDVHAFDATYGRNKYNLSIVVFSGVNHHNQTCVFGAAMVFGMHERQNT
ncbi:hypothetical protein AHAS_Ahas03G0223100 [Arachis hypogaea]